MKRIDGRPDPARRKRAESGADGMRAYVKFVPTYAVRMYEDFAVETMEGVMLGRPGDWLACGPKGEQYPIDAGVFEASYASPYDENDE